MAAPRVCTRHYRAAEATCERCGGGLCSQCRGSSPTALSLCPGCIQFEGDTRRRAELRRADRFALRRAGYAMGFERGDPIVLWSGPLRMAIPAAGMVLLVAVAGTALAAGQIRAGIDVVLGALLISVVIGNAVRRLFGGVSPVAGLFAAAAAVGSALCGRWLAGDGRTLGGAPFEGLRPHTDDLFASGWPLPACLAAAALIAYLAAAGRRTRSLRHHRHAL
jgi:hypothetical protein